MRDGISNEIWQNRSAALYQLWLDAIYMGYPFARDELFVVVTTSLSTDETPWRRGIPFRMQLQDFPFHFFPYSIQRCNAIGTYGSAYLEKSHTWVF